MRGLRTRRAKDRVPGAHKAATNNLHEIIVYKWTSCPVSLPCHRAGCVSYPACHRSAVCHFTNDPLLPLSPASVLFCRYPSALWSSGQRYSTIGTVFFTEMWAKRSSESPSSEKKNKNSPHRQCLSFCSLINYLVFTRMKL